MALGRQSTLKNDDREQMADPQIRSHSDCSEQRARESLEGIRSATIGFSAQSVHQCSSYKLGFADRLWFIGDPSLQPSTVSERSAYHLFLVSPIAAGAAVGMSVAEC